MNKPVPAFISINPIALTRTYIYPLLYRTCLYLPYENISQIRTKSPFDPYFLRQPTAYRPVTAYTATQPILVNGVNINTGLYPVLNYKPPRAQYPYIYVPIAEFSKVGAKVVWDESKQLLSVTTDYYTNKRLIEEQQAKIIQLQNELNKLQSPAPTPAPIPPGFVLDVTSIGGDLTPEQKNEIPNLLAIKNPQEINTMASDARRQLEAYTDSLGGSISGRGGLGEDSLGYVITFVKGNTETDLVTVELHTNDPKLYENYGRYTDTQLAKFRIYSDAAAYVSNRVALERLQAMQ